MRWRFNGRVAIQFLQIGTGPDNYYSVARDFKLWIAGVSNVGWLSDGPWKGRKCIGCSLAIDPDGDQVLIGRYGPDADSILYAEVELRPRPARGDGWERMWSTISDDNT